MSARTPGPWVLQGFRIYGPLDSRSKQAAEATKRGVAGDHCATGNSCGRLGCPECQQ